jgi:hypothetical protein
LQPLPAYHPISCAENYEKKERIERGEKLRKNAVLRIRDLFDPWIRDRFFPDPGSDLISESLKPIFSWLKNEKNAKCPTIMSQDLFQQERKATKR